MDRLNQLRGAAGGSGDSTLDTTAPPSEAFISANESSSKYFSLSEDDSTFDISPIKDVSLASASGDPERTITDADELISNLSPITKKTDRLDSYKIGKQIEAANILSGGVDIFEDNDNSYDGDELVIDDNVELDDKSNPELKQNEPSDLMEPTLMDVETDIASKDTEVVLQIDGKNVDAIDIGNGLYLYRKEGQEELAAVQIIDDDQQQPSFKFLKVRENTEGNLEVYEEIEIEVPKEVPVKEGKSIDKNTSHVPIKDINKVINEPSSNKIADRINKTPQKEIALSASEVESEVKEVSDSKSEVNLNGKMMKFSESRKSPVIGSFTPMTYHSTPKKEGIPLTKTMVDMQLQPSRHSDNIKKTIEVHTDSGKQKHIETPSKTKDSSEDIKDAGIFITDKEETALEDKEPLSKEVGTSELEPNKTDIVMEQIDKDNGADPNEKQETDQIKTSECGLESTDIIIDNEKEESNLVLLTDDIPEDKGLILNCNKTSEENNTVKNLLKLPQTKAIIEEKIIQANKEVNVGDHVTSKIESHDKNEIEDNKKLFDVEENTGLALMTKSTECKSSLSKSEEALVTSLTTTQIISEKCDTQQEVKDDNIINITKENKVESKLEKTSLVVTDCPVDSKSNMEKTLAEQKSHKVSDKDQVNPIIVEQLGCLNEMDVSDVMEVKDEKCIRNEKKPAEEFKKEIDDKIPEENLTTSKAEKQEIMAVEITKQIDIVLNKPKECDKTVENQSMSTEDVEPTTMCAMKNKLENKGTDSVVKDVKGTLITMSQEKHSNTVPDTKQVNLNIPKDLHVNKQDETKVSSKTVPEKLATSKAKDIQEASHSNICLQKIVAIDKAKEIKVPSLEADSKQTVANNKAEMSLKTENTNNSNKTVPTAPMSKITFNKTNTPFNIKHETSDSKKGISKVPTHVDTKPTNNNNAAVPFGKWTEANRQEFLNKIKETKVPVHVSNSKPIKNSNDLNRRDVLKKIDSQRQSNHAASKAQESTKINIKNENVFTNKPIIAVQEPVVQNVGQDSKIPVKLESTDSKNKDIVIKKVAKQEGVNKPPVVSTMTPVVTTSTVTAVTKKEVVQRKAVNAQDLIDKTIEGMINKGYPTKLHGAEGKSSSAKDSNVQRNVDAFTGQPSAVPPTTLDAIEMKMNELHGIPFIERPPHELPRLQNPPFKNYNKVDKEKPIENKGTKIPNLLPFSNKNPPKVKENVVDVDSEEEILEHEPVTGDIEMPKKVLASNLPLKDKMVTVDSDSIISVEPSKKETIITENEFDKFARRNSVTYENCITVNFDGKEQHNVIQTVVEKDIVKSYSKNEPSGVESKPKLAQKPQTVRQNTNTSKPQLAPKVVSSSEDASNKNYQSKLQIAYQSALTAKRHLEGPITVIEDKPVKVVYVDANPEFIASKLNVQGQNLSPVKKHALELDAVKTNDLLDHEMADTIDDKLQDESKPKTKHQRKQVLTPVEAPELELIEPGDLGIEVSPKKKRRTEDARADKTTKNLIHKKSYLLGRTPVVEDKVTKPPEVTINPVKESTHRNDNLGSKDTVTALDNLVKAAELLENQSESMNTSIDPNSESQSSTPVKRGRGRPRKYPLPEGAVDKVKVPSPQKKPRLIDAKPTKRDTTTEEEESSDEEIVKENWTMGKINENIVCPICNKLFRSENVVFKHVKHCTGPSPNRSDAEKRSVRRIRQSQESDSKSEDMDIDEEISKEIMKYTPKKRRSKDSSIKSDTDKEDIIVIEDTPVKDKSEKDDDRKHHESRKLSKTKIHNRIVNNLVCEFCGKTFRQLSYLANHKLQHKKEDAKKTDKDIQLPKSVLSCEVCKKEFRKLHHLAQHRSIHNAQTVSSRLSRKSSSEQEESKSEKEDNSKQNDDTSAGFRCEPCDKSFRKLHHLVEHRETHDGINRQKSATTVQTAVEKPTPPPQCDICKKTFRKLHHLIEHKEQHVETSSEKSDDKSVKSSLSTKDIIHECPLCYMVFPNEHSLNKHHIICQRKKRQSKQPKPILEEDGDTLDMEETAKSEESKLEDNDEPEIISEEVKVINLDKDDKKEKVEATLPAENNDIIEIIEEPPPVEVKEISVKNQELPKEEEEIKNPTTKYSTTKVEVPSAIPEVEMKIEEKEVEKVQDVPKKKTPAKSKVTATVTKRQKMSAPAPRETDKSSMETSDEDDVRYMLNPNFKVDETSEGKVFMKVRAKKRNSLQIERPNSKDLIKRRTSLQHPPKIPRLKPKPIEPKVTTPVLKNSAKTPKLEPVPSTDSDDSDVKYSFPKTTPERTTLRDRSSRELEKRPQRKSLTEKRKTLSGIAKRKSLGKSAGVRHKEAASPPKPIKRRTAEVGHRCDCGQLFSSAALLSRHTTLAHTPPRIRKRRSPPPDIAKPTIRPPPKNTADKPKHTVGSRKSSVRSDTSTSNTKSSVTTRKSTVKNDAKTPTNTRKSIKPVEKVEPKTSNAPNAKGRRSIATRTTAIPEKGKKPTQKSKI